MKNDSFKKVNINNFYHQISDLYENLTIFVKKFKTKLKNLVLTNFDLGIYHFKKGNIIDALFRFKMVLYFKPDYPIAYYYLSRCMVLRNQNQKAIKILKSSIEKGFSCPESFYLLASLDKNQIPPKQIPINIIKDYFDNLSYDKNLSNLSPVKYVDAKLLFKICAEIIDQKQKSIVDMLDLGCGFGISSFYFKEKFPSSNITGVDISCGMISESKKLNTYSFSLNNNTDLHLKLNSQLKADHIPIFDNLIHADLREFIKNTNKKYDLIIAQDSLHYDQDLLSILMNIKNCLNEGGMVAFSIEKSDAEDVMLNDLMKNYCFNIKSIEDVIKKANFKKLQITQNRINDDQTYWYVVVGCNKF